MCPCGSGLRALHCCSLNIATLPPPEATRHLMPLVERALQAHRQGATETAEQLCLDVLELAPDRPGALSISPSSAMSLSSTFSAIFSLPSKPKARAISRLPAGVSVLAMKSRTCWRVGRPLDLL